VSLVAAAGLCEDLRRDELEVEPGVHVEVEGAVGVDVGSEQRREPAQVGVGEVLATRYFAAGDSNPRRGPSAGAVVAAVVWAALEREYGCAVADGRRDPMRLDAPRFYPRGEPLGGSQRWFSLSQLPGYEAGGSAFWLPLRS
jgi:hypothetical protein